MKITLFGAASLIGLGLAGAAAAQNSGDITIGSTVAPYCSALQGDGSVLQLGDLADAQGFVIEDKSVGFWTQTYWCNAPTTVTLATEPLTNQDVATVSDDGFTTRIDYTAGWAWGNLSNTKLSTDPDQDTEVTAANSGSLVISASSLFTDGNRRPVAGAYVGSVTLTVVPQS